MLFVQKVWLTCKARGAYLLLENPLASQAWRLMPWLGKEGFLASITHQCGEGSSLVDFLGDPVLKATRWYTNSVCVANILNQIRCPGHDFHASVIGRPERVSGMFGNWTPELANSILDGALQQRIVDSTLVSEAYPIEPRMQASVDVLFRDRDVPEPESWNRVPPLLRTAIKKIHEGFSHVPCKESLVRLLAHSGASEVAIAAAKYFRCDLCEANARHANRPVAAIPRYRRFNEALTMDFMTIPDLTKSMHSVLAIIDIASDFCCLKYVNEGSRPTASSSTRI